MEEYINKIIQSFSQKVKELLDGSTKDFRNIKIEIENVVSVYPEVKLESFKLDELFTGPVKVVIDGSVQVLQKDLHNTKKYVSYDFMPTEVELQFETETKEFTLLNTPELILT